MRRSVERVRERPRPDQAAAAFLSTIYGLGVDASNDYVGLPRSSINHRFIFFPNHSSETCL